MHAYVVFIFELFENDRNNSVAAKQLRSKAFFMTLCLRFSRFFRAF
jgi:hypothetical protein